MLWVFMLRKSSKRKRKMALAAALLLMGGIAVAFFLCMAYLARHERLLWNDAATAYKAGQYDLAAEKLSELTRKEPSHEDGFRLLAKIDEARWDYLGAASNWRKVRELNNGDEEARQRLIECLLTSLQYSIIIKLYEKEYADGFLDSHELLAYAEAVIMVGDKNMIDMVMEHVNEVVGDQIQISFLDGIKAIRTGDYEDGRQILEKLLKAELPNSFRWRLEVILGGVMNSNGDVEGAEAHYLRANSIVPELTNGLLGDFCRLNRMYEKSAEYWRKELEYHPADDYPRMQLVEIYGGLGDKARLQELWKTLEPINRSRKELYNYSEAALFFLGHDYEKTLGALKKCLGFYERDFYHVMRLCCILELDLKDHLEDDMAFLRQKPLDVNFVQMVISYLHQSLQKSLKENDVKTAVWYAELMWSFTRMELPEMRVAAKLLMAERYKARYFYDALELAKFCQKFEAKDDEVLHVLMMSSLGAGNFNDCLTYSAIIGDDDVEALVARGNALAFGGLWEDSAKAFEKALSLDPGNAMLKEYSWRLFREFGMEERMTKVESMYGNDGMDKVRQSCLVALHQLWRKDQMGFSSASSKIIGNMIPEGKAGDAELRYWRGVLLSWNDILDDGISELKNVLRLGKADAFVLCELSEAYARKGKVIDALDIARGTAQLWPGWYVYDRCLRRHEEEVRKQKPDDIKRWKIEMEMKKEKKDEQTEKEDEQFDTEDEMQK